MKIPMRATLIAAIITTTLGGCAHSLVYDEARDKQAQEAKRASGELKMADTVRQLEKGYAEVAKLEVESAKLLAEMLRNKELARVATASALREKGPPPAPGEMSELNGLLNVLEDRMTELGAKPRAKDAAEAGSGRNCGGLDCGSLKVIQATPVLLQARRETFELSRAEFRAFFGYDFRTCADVEAARDATGALKRVFEEKFAPAAQRSAVKTGDYYKRLVTNCANLKRAQTAFNAAIGSEEPGSIRAVLTQAERVEKDIANRRAKLVAAEQRLASEVQKFKREEEELAPNEQSSLATFQKRADALKNAVARIKKGADAVAGDAGPHAAAKELVNQLETVIGAIAGQESATDKLDPQDKAAVAFVRALPELADEADKLLKEAGRARLVPFAVAREHYRLEVKGFEDDLAIKTRRMEALRARADAMTRELSALSRSHYLLTEGKTKRAWEPQTLAQLNSTLAQVNTTEGRRDRQNLYEALATYWDEVFFYRSEEQMWKARAGALQYDEGLARSTAAALQWDNLIGGVGTVLADYHASGVKPADIADFLKALGLVYIGTRIGR
jgi:hypothetical protein